MGTKNQEIATAIAGEVKVLGTVNLAARIATALDEAEARGAESAELVNWARDAFDAIDDSCPNMPACDDEDEPLDRSDWCNLCLVRERAPEAIRARGTK